MATIKEDSEIFDLIKQLGAIRKIPQFLFCDNTYYWRWVKLKDELVLFNSQFSDVKEIDFILYSAGGSPDDAYRIIRTLRQNFETVNIIIPFWAKSAATLLSLGGSKIIMAKTAEFGPIDIQVPKAKEDSPGYEYESALTDEVSLELVENRAQIRFASMYIDYYENENLHIPKTDLSKQLMEHISKFYEPLLNQINPYKLGEKKRKSDISTAYANKILTQYHDMDDKQQKTFVDYLVTACPEHGFVIDFDTLNDILPNVIQAKDFVEDGNYEKILDQVACYFIKDTSNDKYIGFVPKIEIDSAVGTKEEVDGGEIAPVTQISPKGE